MTEEARRLPQYATTRGPNRRMLSTALLALAAITAIAGCSSGGHDKAQQSPSPSAASATSTLSPAEVQARKDIVAAYRGMTRERVKAYAHSSLAGSNITKYATGKALRDVKDAVFVDRRHGIVFKGEPRVAASDEDVTLKTADKPSRASLVVCFDTNTWEPINKKTGKSVAVSDQVKRYTITADLQLVGSQWLVTEQNADQGKTC